MTETMSSDDLQPNDHPIGLSRLKPLKCELANPNADWTRIWLRARMQGLGPELISFALQMLWGILPRGLGGSGAPLIRPTSSNFMGDSDSVKILGVQGILIVWQQVAAWFGLVS